MTDQLRARLAELHQEYETGQRRLQELMAQEVAVRETILRISGAIQVLEELAGEAADGTAPGNRPGDKLGDGREPGTDPGAVAQPAPGTVLSVG
jgi:hypothetical protein